MMYQEFKNECAELGMTEFNLKDNEFEQIHMVYVYHPSIKTKQDIARLFVYFGMTVIYDMLQRAEIICEKEKEISTKRMELEKLLEQMENIKS